MEWTIGVAIGVGVLLLAAWGFRAWRLRQRDRRAEEFLEAVEAFGEQREPARAGVSPRGAGERAPAGAGDRTPRARLVLDPAVDFETVGDALSSLGCEAVPGSWVHGQAGEPRAHAWTCRDSRVDYERDGDLRRLVVTGAPEGRELARSLRGLLPVIEPDDLVRRLSTATRSDSLQYLLRAGAWRFSGDDGDAASLFRDRAGDLADHDDPGVAAAAREALEPLD